MTTAFRIIKFNFRDKEAFASTLWVAASTIKNDKRNHFFCWRWSTMKFERLAVCGFFTAPTFDGRFEWWRIFFFYCSLTGRDHFVCPRPTPTHKPHQEWLKWKCSLGFAFSFGRTEIFVPSILCPLRLLIVPRPVTFLRFSASSRQTKALGHDNGSEQIRIALQRRRKKRFFIIVCTTKLLQRRSSCEIWYLHPCAAYSDRAWRS